MYCTSECYKLVHLMHCCFESLCVWIVWHIQLSLRKSLESLSIFSFLPIKHNIVLSNHSEFLSFLLGTGGRNLRSLQTSIVSVGESTKPMEVESYSPCYLIWPTIQSYHTTLTAIWLGMSLKDKPNTEKTLRCFLSCTCDLFHCTTKKKKTPLKIFVQ